MTYEPTIGLEIHAELKTETKMFCDSVNDSEEKHTNHNVCPICLGHPGCLPTINKKAVESVIKVGFALGGKINPLTKFDRKNYFYPDLPKGYQISQYDEPLVIGGTLNGVRLRRIHLEEDTGRLIHDETTNASLVDYNRAGVPLMELVTEPDIKSGEETVNFAKEFQLILRYLNVSNADMEKGELRIEANVSLNMGTKVELKNINSFRSVGDAIAYELKRQEKILKAGEKVAHETRGWDDIKKKTYSQRSKEEAHDYRYFPEPDLPPFETSVFDLEKIKNDLPELPADKRARFKNEFALDESKIETLIINPHLAEFFEEAVSELKSFGEKLTPQTLLNYLTGDLVGLLNESGLKFEEIKIKPEHLAHLSFLIDSGRIGSRQAKDILKRMFETGVDPELIIKEDNLETVSDESELVKIIEKIILENPKAVEDYKKGKIASLQFLIGKTMSELRGRGNPDTLKMLFKTAIDKIA
ncbi:MAG: Asp-tRNA(Asn)/Glu-tRNA(Gln) amidotransferase subunit GatB [Candidatus Paceibacterota bacterium]|jgi:aspartyl-tRNA(Asn)/glutamyl-tRNA(Gln) amidotransferase subunit B